MTLAEYQTLTGTTVPDSDVARINAIIRRCTARLESLLGYSLFRQKTWTELGKVQYNGYTPFPSLPVSDDVLNNLKAADDQTGDLQLFSFDKQDKHIKINPAKEIYRAKIVLPVDQDEFITIYDLESGTPYLNSVGLVTAITRYHSWFSWDGWDSLQLSSRVKLMFAVDAEYIEVCDVNRYPELAYLLADMVTYYSDPGYSLLGVIRSETIDSHTYTRALSGAFNGKLPTPEDMAPEGQITAQRIIAKFAGPGAFNKMVR